MSASHAEQALVGAVLLDPSILGELHDLVHPADLTSEPLREVLRAAEGLRTDGEAVDLVTVTERLASRDMLPGAGGAAFVADLVARTPTAANWRSYAATVAA
ncbi:MAG: DnaB-like helicase N-terminal domain-containing protein, partial [Reyranellaceae bacterium]